MINWMIGVMSTLGRSPRKRAAKTAGAPCGSRGSVGPERARVRPEAGIGVGCCRVSFEFMSLSASS